MLLTNFRRLRFIAAIIALALLATSCGDDDQDTASLDLESWLATTSTSTTVASTTTTTTSTTTTTTTAPPRQLTEDQLRGALLQPEDVPAQANVVDETLPSPWGTTDPPACGEILGADGPAEVRVARALYEPQGFLVYQSIVQHTPDKVDDLDDFRAGIAGPCAEGFRYIEDGSDSWQRFDPLPDPDVGDDALAARFEMQYEVDGRQVETWGYMVYFVRDGVSVQVQVLSGAIPAEGLVGPEISVEEVIRLADQLDERVRAL